jgi:hypothetical protein
MYTHLTIILILSEINPTENINNQSPEPPLKLLLNVPVTCSIKVQMIENIREMTRESKILHRI